MKKLLLTALISVFSIGTMTTASLADENYTSLIIDCSELGLNKAMSPMVRSEKGQAVYPSDTIASQIKMEDVLSGSYITYQRNIDNAKIHKIAGKKPLIIKAISLDGILKSDPVISRLDAIRLSLANNEGKFLNRHKVIIAY